MRIVGGSARGRKLLTPAGEHTRPTSERTREALFSILGPRVYDARVLDAFAGSGALGLEACSRGAGSAVLCDNDRQALQCIRKNVQALGFAVTLHAGDTRQLLPMLAAQKQQFDLIFLDPPYQAGLMDETLAACQPLLADDGLIICETEADTAPACPAGLVVCDSRRYGRNRLYFFAHTAG